MDWTQNSIGHVVGIVPWIAFLLGVAWYAVRGLIVDLRDDRPRTAQAELPTEPRPSRSPQRRPAAGARSGRRVPATR